MLARTLISECPAQKHVVGCFFLGGGVIEAGVNCASRQPALRST